MIEFNLDNGKIAKLLIEHGANVNVSDKDGNTPLHLATRYGKYKKIFKEKNERWKLMKKYDLESDGMVELLIKSGANADVPNNEGQTVLNWAASRGR